MHSASWLLLVALSNGWWEASFTAHSENVGLLITYQCPTFFAYNWFDLDPDMTSARVHRVETPAGESCLIVGTIMRHRPEAPLHEYYPGESTVEPDTTE